MTDDRPYVVESPTRVKWTREAEHWRREWGMTRVEFARYLLHRHEHEGDHAEVESIDTPQVEVHNIERI